MVCLKVPTSMDSGEGEGWVEDLLQVTMEIKKVAVDKDVKK